MNYATGLFILIPFIISGCTQNIASFKGDYKNTGKYETYGSNSATGEIKSDRGYSVKIDGDSITAVPVTIKNGEITGSDSSEAFKLTNGDYETPVYRHPDGKSMKSFMFSGKTLIVDEYILNNEGVFTLDKRYVFEKI